MITASGEQNSYDATFVNYPLIFTAHEGEGKERGNDFDKGELRPPLREPRELGLQAFNLLVLFSHFHFTLVQNFNISPSLPQLFLG